MASLSPPLPRSGRRRWRTWLVRLALVPVFLAAGLLAYVRVYQFRAAVAWAEALAEADRLDPGWRWEDLEAQRPAIPDDQNAALLIIRLNGQWPTGASVHEAPVVGPLDRYPGRYMADLEIV